MVRCQSEFLSVVGFLAFHSADEQQVFASLVIGKPDVPSLFHELQQSDTALPNLLWPPLIAIADLDLGMRAVGVAVSKFGSIGLEFGLFLLRKGVVLQGGVDRRRQEHQVRELRKVKPMRQIEMAELMCASHNFSVDYAKCLLAATRNEQLLEQSHPKEVNGLTTDEMARMEYEMESIGRDFKMIEDSHGRNVLNLVIVVGYVKKLLENARVVRYLSQSCPEILSEFQKIAEAKRLADAAAG